MLTTSRDILAVITALDVRGWSRYSMIGPDGELSLLAAMNMVVGVPVSRMTEDFVTIQSWLPDLRALRFTLLYETIEGSLGDPVLANEQFTSVDEVMTALAEAVGRITN